MNSKLRHSIKVGTIVGPVMAGITKGCWLLFGIVLPGEAIALMMPFVTAGLSAVLPDEWESPE